MDESHLEVLADLKFQASVDEVKDITLLDTARLANLWQLCRMTNPAGSLIERRLLQRRWRHPYFQQLPGPHHFCLRYL